MARFYTVALQADLLDDWSVVRLLSSWPVTCHPVVR
jgi:hypothetical protein